MSVGVVAGLLAATWFFFLARATGRSPVAWALIGFLIPILTFVLTFAGLAGLFESLYLALVAPAVIALAILLVLRAKFLRPGGPHAPHQTADS